MKLFKTILSLLLVPLLLLQTLPAAVAADTPEDSNQCTVNFVAAGNSEGSETANVDDVITLSSTVSAALKAGRSAAGQMQNLPRRPRNPHSMPRAQATLSPQTQLCMRCSPALKKSQET